MQLLYKIIFLLTPNERRKAYLLLIMILIMALLDLIGVASVMPFIAILSNPDIIETNKFIFSSFIFLKEFGIETKQQFLFTAGLLVFVLLLFSLSFKALTVYAQMRFSHMREYSIGKRLIEGYLRQPYSWFLSRNSSDLGKNILSEVNEVISSGIAPMMILIAHSAVTFAIMSLLIFVDYKLALTTFFTLSIAYGIIYKLNRKLLKSIGQQRVNANLSRFTAVSEAFGAIKALKVAGLESVYIQRFAEPANKYSRNQASVVAIQQIPRYGIEAIAFGGMILVVLYIIARGDTFTNAIPIIALYAFAGYRLMPALQAIYGSSTKLRFVGPALDVLHFHLKNLSSEVKFETKEVLDFKFLLKLQNIDYYYPNTSDPALRSINIEIPVGSTIGFVGSTGSGKSTTLDIILGLLEPNSGFLEIDNKKIIKQNKIAWQKLIGYVPQHIYLADDTVAANIAFGIESKNIDYKAIEQAAKIANIDEFIKNDLPHKYKTKVGERGIRLSGGQRQRLGIARAVYNKPKVLILDEATSALDNLTEKNVIKALQNIDKEVTIIMVAHRLSTVKKCDKIYFFKNGKIKNHGSFEELINQNDEFRAAAKNI